MRRWRRSDPVEQHDGSLSVRQVCLIPSSALVPFEQKQSCCQDLQVICRSSPPELCCRARSVGGIMQTCRIPVGRI